MEINNLRIFILLLTATLGTYRANGQQLPLRNFSVAAGLHHGFIIPHRSTVNEVIDGHTNGIEIDLIKQTQGDKEWQKAYGLPETGLSLSFWNYGNPDELGYGTAIIPYIDFPMAWGRKLSLDLRFGWGLSYISEKFDYEDNYKNLTIGTNINYAILVFPHFRYRFSERVAAGAGFGLTHFSNGALQMPNLGINIASASVAVHYSFGKSIENTYSKDTVKFGTLPYWTFYGAAGLKEKYPVMGPKYAAFTFFADRSFQVTRKSAFGGGVDIFYDQSDMVVLEEEEEGKDLPLSEAVKVGIHGSYELCISRLSFTFNIGTYLYANVTTYGRVYNRIGTRYKINDRWFACLNLKTHYGKADYVEYGIGYTIKNKRKWDS